MAATTYEHKIAEQLRDITAETDPNVLFRRARMLAGLFEAAELDDVHAALMETLHRLIANAWLAEREGEPVADSRLCEQMEAAILKAEMLVRLAVEPHGDDDPIAAHPILSGMPLQASADEPEILSLEN